MRIYDTLTRQLQEFQPLEPGHVRMYTCGPTVYDFAHIGNFRTYVWEDLLRRTLKLHGFKVTQVMNITDIEDKIIAKMAAEEKSLQEVTDPYIEAFFEDLDTLRIERAEHYPRATEHLAEMIELTRQLQDRGLTYASKDSLYFRIDAFADYGRLSSLDKRQIVSGARLIAVSLCAHQCPVPCFADPRPNTLFNGDCRLMTNPQAKIQKANVSSNAEIRTTHPLLRARSFSKPYPASQNKWRTPLPR